jgi:lipopolysaccharide/colanic/teichoic acid biosynthesis glycosyltransferase
MIVNHSKTLIKITGENRITPFWALLRKYKMDELPELWNIQNI